MQTISKRIIFKISPSNAEGAAKVAFERLLALVNAEGEIPLSPGVQASEEQVERILSQGNKLMQGGSVVEAAKLAIPQLNVIVDSVEEVIKVYNSRTHSAASIATDGSKGISTYKYRLEASGCHIQGQIVLESHYLFATTALKVNEGHFRTD